MKTIRLILIFATACLLNCNATAQGHFTERDTIDVLHYDIQLDMGHHQPSHIQGSCQVLLQLLQPTTHVRLGLESATIDSILVNNSLVPATEWNYDNHQLTVPVTGNSLNDTLSVTVYYGSYGYVGVDGGFWCLDRLFYNLGEDRYTRPFSMGRSWFPCSDSVYDRATYTFGITVSPGWTAVCSGEHDSTVLNADSSLTYHYTLHHPISTYQAGINAAPYYTYNYNVQGLYDTYPVHIACFDDNSTAVMRNFNTLEHTLQLYERLFGPYRWDNIGFSEGGRNAGMEHVNTICISYDYPDFKYLIDHEFAHQWFGNLVTCAHLNDMWFNEGGATFADQLAGLDGTPTSYEIMYRKAATLSQTPLNENGFYPLYGMPNQYAFMHTTYYKGAMVFHELNQLLGDSVFFSMLQTLFRQNAFTNMDSYQLRDSMSRYSGTDLTDFFNFHIFNPGFASYSIDSMQTADGLTTLWLHQRLWHAPDYCTQANIPVTFFSANGDTLTYHVASNGRYTQGQFRLPFEPAFAIVDYYNRTASAEVSDNIHLNSTQRYSSTPTDFIISPTMINSESDIYVTLQYGTPDEAPMPGIVRWDNRRWFINGNYSNNFKAKTGFCYGEGSPVYDKGFYLTPDTEDSLRLFYRKSPSKPWRMRKTATHESVSQLGSHYSYMQIVGTPLKGEFIMAVVDTALLSIPYDEDPVSTPQLTLSPNPAKDHVDIHVSLAEPQPCQIILRNATGREIMRKDFQLSTLNSQLSTLNFQLSTASLPAGIYFVTLTSPTGTYTRKLLIQ